MYIDGELKGKTPWQGSVPSGRRQIDFKLKTYRDATRYTRIKQGRSYEVVGVLVEEHVGALLSVNSIPAGADVTLDGAVIGQTPLVRHPVEAAHHSLSIAQNGFVPSTMQFRISEGSHVEQTVSMHSLQSISPNGDVHWGAWTLMGTGGAIVLSGIAFGLVALDKNLTADRIARTERGIDAQRKYDSMVVDSRQYATLADGALLSGTLALTSGIIWALYNDDGK